MPIQLLEIFKQHMEHVIDSIKFINSTLGTAKVNILGTIKKKLQEENKASTFPQRLFFFFKNTSKIKSPFFYLLFERNMQKLPNAKILHPI